MILFDENRPKYKQIYHSIRQLIEKGDLEPDTHLPSIRQLAESLNVSRNTSLIAYEQLLAEGYIRSVHKKGYYVEPFTPIHISGPQETEQPMISGKKKIAIDFRAGAVDQQAFPLKDWRRCSNEVLRQKITYTYGQRNGELQLRKEIANYLLQSRGIQTGPASIIIGSSTQQLLMQLAILLKAFYSSIAVENPGYDGARSIFEMHQFEIAPIDVTSKGISMQQLQQSSARLVYITPSHHFPLGVTMPIPERQQLLKWVQEVNGYIIEDDYDSEFRYKQQPIPALCSLIPDARVIYLGTFSKVFLPSIRLSYMVLPAPLLERFNQLFDNVEQTASVIHQQTMALFMERGHWDSHIRKMRATYKRKMQTLVSTLQETFGEAITLIGTVSGLYLLIEFQSGTTEDTLIPQALEQGVKVYPTSQYYINQKPPRPMLQLGFSNLSIEEIKKGVHLLKQAWIG